MVRSTSRDSNEVLILSFRRDSLTIVGVNLVSPLRDFSLNEFIYKLKGGEETRRRRQVIFVVYTLLKI